MKRLLLTIPNLGKGGAQQIFRDQVAFFSKHTKVTSCVFNWDDSFPEDRIGILSLNVPAGKNVLSKSYFFLKRIYRLRKIKEDHKIDISISHLEGADYVNILSRRNEKIILWIHGTKKFDNNIEGVLGWLRKKLMIPTLYRRAKLIVTVSEGIRHELIEEFDLRAATIVTISNGISLQNIMHSSAAAGSAALFSIIKPALILITHCRFARQKNLTALLRIFAKVKIVLPTKMIFVGDGELTGQLIEQSRSLQLITYSFWEDKPLSESNDVFFIGYQRNPYQYLANATLYLLTSSWEGFPLSMCEAMACQLPVVAADCFTGPREILSPGIYSIMPVARPFFSKGGVLMPLADSDSAIQVWADVICKVLSDDGLRQKMIRGAVDRAKDFDMRKIEKHWLDLLVNGGANQ